MLWSRHMLIAWVSWNWNLWITTPSTAHWTRHSTFKRTRRHHSPRMPSVPRASHHSAQMHTAVGCAWKLQWTHILDSLRHRTTARPAQGQHAPGPHATTALCASDRVPHGATYGWRRAWTPYESLPALPTLHRSSLSTLPARLAPTSTKTVRCHAHHRPGGRAPWHVACALGSAAALTYRSQLRLRRRSQAPPRATSRAPSPFGASDLVLV
jgi:hypothetical protein